MNVSRAESLIFQIIKKNGSNPMNPGVDNCNANLYEG